MLTGKKVLKIFPGAVLLALGITVLSSTPRLLVWDPIRLLTLGLLLLIGLFFTLFGIVMVVDTAREL